MKILKRILVAVAMIIVLLLVIALFVKKDYTIVRDITINKPRSEVFDYIKLLRNQNNFSKWATLDPGMKKDFSGTDGTVGFVSSWDSENGSVGKGEQEIKNITEGQRVDYEIRFKKPMASVARSCMTTEAVSDNQTKVSWSFSGHMAYPLNLMRLFGMENMLGDQLQTGLDNLKRIKEKE